MKTNKAYEKIISTVNLPREEWLKARRGGIGGSDIGAIMGLNPFSSPHQVFLEKTAAYEKDLSENEAVYWGNVLEDVVAKEFERRTGKHVRKMNALIRSTRTPFAFANVDRMIVGEDAGLECKTTNAFSSDEWKDGEVPASYICQCQWYMFVTGLQKWHIACLIGGQKFVHYEIVRDDELIEYMLEKATDFWENNVLTGEAPPLGGARADDDFLADKYPISNGGEVKLTSEISSIAEALLRIKELQKEQEKQKKALENQIKDYLGEAERGESARVIVSWKTQNGARKLNLDALCRDYEIENLDEYYSQSTLRKFSIKENKEEK